MRNRYGDDEDRHRSGRAIIAELEHVYMYTNGAKFRPTDLGSFFMEYARKIIQSRGQEGTVKFVVAFEAKLGIKVTSNSNIKSNVDRPNLC